MANTRYWVTGGNGNWNSTTNWSASSGGSSGSTTPTSTTITIFDANSGAGTSTINTIFSIQSLNCATFTGTLTHNNLLQIGNSVDGSLTFGSGMVYSPGILALITFVGTITGNTVTSAGQVFNSVSFTGAGGGWTLQDDLSTKTYNQASKGILTLQNGTFNANNHNISAGTISISPLTALTVNMGSGTWTVFDNATSCSFDSSSTNLTLNYNTSTLVLGAGSTNTFSGQTYYNITFNVNNGNSSDTSDNFTTIGNLLFNVSSTGGTVTFQDSLTYTIGGTISATGTSVSNVLIINSYDPGSQFTFSKASGIVSMDWLNLTDSNATGGAHFYAGANSINTSDNTGWIFTVPPPSSSLIEGLHTSSIGKVNRQFKNKFGEGSHNTFLN